MDDQQHEPTAKPHVHLLAEHHLTAKNSASGTDAFFTSARWTADGTSILTTSSDQIVSIFVLPDDLLESDASRPLTPQSSTKLPEPTQVVAVAPYFSLTESSSQTFLAASRDHPIHLYHAFPNEGRMTPLCGYKLIRKETEEYIKPSSMMWNYPGTHFICGSVNRIDMFDISQHGSDGPVLTLPTIPSRRHISKGSGVGMKGTVSALAASPPAADGGSVIAAGTWTRWVGLYDIHRTNKTVANWNIAGAVEAGSPDIGGQGISQTLWSPCGRYLLLNERNASGLLVYDVRVTGQLLSILTGREADTQQRLNCDAFPGEDGGFEVWAGTQNGDVKVWEGVGLHSEYGVEPSWGWQGHESPVSNAVLHAGGSVVATCSGGWEHSKAFDGEGGMDGSGTDVLEESSVKVWSINSLHS